jgi:hypothetical protein
METGCSSKTSKCLSTTRCRNSKEYHNLGQYNPFVGKDRLRAFLIDPLLKELGNY